MTVAGDLLNIVNLLTDLLISWESLLKLLHNVEIDDQCVVGVCVKLTMRQLLGIPPIDTLHKPDREHDYTEKTILDVKQLILS